VAKLKIAKLEVDIYVFTYFHNFGVMNYSEAIIPGVIKSFK